MSTLVLEPVATRSHDDPDYRHDLGDGLVLRWSTPRDTEPLADLYSYVFRNKADGPENWRLAVWTREMMSDRHPLIGSRDFALVEDTARGTIVAATCLLSQTWEYAGIPFPVGRPEIVASHPDYRRRGLVRAVFELIHARSSGLGHMAQGITGIPYYYRQFGYEYALDLGGSRSVYLTSIPRLKDGTAEPYTLRDMVTGDLPFVMALYDRERAGALVSTRIDEEYRCFVLEGFGHESGNSAHTHIIVDAASRPVGYVATGRIRWDSALPVFNLAVAAGLSLAAVIPSVLRALQAHAAEVPTFQPGGPEPASIVFALGCPHAAYEALGEGLTGRQEPPYAWYVRVPDLPAFLRHIAPVLEQRLKESVMAGHSGELRLDFYRGGLRLVFEDGRLASAGEWQAEVWGEDAHAGFPPLVFLQLLFGRRSLGDLRYAFPDVWADDQAKILLPILFPTQPSWVVPLA